LKDIRLDNYTTFSSITGNDIKGIIGGTINYSGQYDSLINGTGEAELAIADGRVELPQPILSFDSIVFDVIRMRMSLNNQKIHVKKVELEWQDIIGKLSGTIFLKKEIPKSRLNLKGAIEFLAGRVKGSNGAGNAERLLNARSKTGKLNFMVDGTFISPRFRFI